MQAVAEIIPDFRQIGAQRDRPSVRGAGLLEAAQVFQRNSEIIYRFDEVGMDLKGAAIPCYRSLKPTGVMLPERCTQGMLGGGRRAGSARRRIYPRPFRRHATSLAWA
jgi:hypothetical protein